MRHPPLAVMRQGHERVIQCITPRVLTLAGDEALQPARHIASSIPNGRRQRPRAPSRQGCLHEIPALLQRIR
eukprot:741249-Prymnesium_polylepis.2